MPEEKFICPENAGGKKILTALLLRAPVQGTVRNLDMPPLPEDAVCVQGRNNMGKAAMGGASFPLFCGRKVLWPGQPLLAVAGPDRAELEKWLSEVAVDIEAPPAPSPPEERAEERAKEPKEEPEENLRFLSRGNPEQVFAAAAQTVQEELHIPPIRYRKENRVITCIKEGSVYSIHAETNWPGALRRQVSRALKTERENVRIRPYPVSNAFEHCSWLPAVDACRAALLAQKAKRSLRLLVNAGNTSWPGLSTPEARVSIRGALNPEGRIAALDIDFTLETGVSFPFEDEFIDRFIMGLFSIYPCKNYCLRGRVLRRQLPPSAHGPAMGFTLGFMAGELFASRAAGLSGQQPGIWRKKSFPVTGQVFGTGIPLPREFPLPGILDKLLAVSDYDRKYASFEHVRKNRDSLRVLPDEHRGTGISCAWFGNGFIGQPKELGAASVKVTLETDGRLSTDIPRHCVNEFLRKSWNKMAADILGPESVPLSFAPELLPGSTDPGPTTMGRNTSVYTRLLEQAFTDLSRRRFRAPLPISSSRTRRRHTRKPWLGETLEGSPFDTMSWGACVVDVSVNRITGRVRPGRIWLVIDGGRLLNPQFSRSAVEWAVERTLNWCLGPEAVQARPFIDIQFYSSPSARQRPRDVSTLPWLCIPAALAQALEQAGCTSSSAFPVTCCLADNGGNAT